jgi:hypothetical protein
MRFLNSISLFHKLPQQLSRSETLYDKTAIPFFKATNKLAVAKIKKRGSKIVNQLSLPIIPTAF